MGTDELKKEFSEELTINWEEIKKIRSPKKIIEYFQSVYNKWIVFCIKLENASKEEYTQKLEALEADIKEHPDYQVMEKRLNALEMLYKESERQKEAALKKLKEQEQEIRILRNQKKAGRPSVEQWIIDRIEELRDQGLSVRKIQKALEAEGISVSVAVVGKYISVYNKNRQSTEVDNTDMI